MHLFLMLQSCDCSQAFKTGLLKLLIEKNKLLNERVKPALTLLGIKCSRHLDILGANSV
jgi:hypothetical protein